MKRDFKETIEEAVRFDSISLKIASPEIIRAWSKGEVKKPETSEDNTSTKTKMNESYIY